MQRGETGALRCGPLLVRYGRGEVGAAKEAAISIRPHEVELSRQVVDGDNHFSAVVVRHTYIGAQRDYLLELDGGVQMRALAPLDPHFEPGESVCVHLPERHCRALAR
jgi:iron(III) transport system ATP-binding protein